MAYYVPPSEKVGGHVFRVPHQIAPMLNVIHTTANFGTYVSFWCSIRDADFTTRFQDMSQKIGTYQGRLQFNSVTRAHHTYYADWIWIQPFEACLTEISIVLAGNIVTLWRWLRNNRSLCNQRHRAMITPVRPVRTQLIHMSPSY